MQFKTTSWKLGPSLKTALKPNTDVLNDCIILLQGVMEKLIQTGWTCPLSTACHMNHIHTFLPYLKQDSSFGMLEQSLHTLQPCVVTAVKLIPSASHTS